MHLDSMVKFLKLNWLARTPFEYKHARVIARLRFAAGGVLLVIAAILYGSGSGSSPCWARRPGTRWMTCSRIGCGGPGVGLAGGRTCG
jgi:hypothetical protein